jgi:hypothetical protein
MSRLVWIAAPVLAVGTCIAVAFLVLGNPRGNTPDIASDRESVEAAAHHRVAQPKSNETAKHPTEGKVDRIEPMRAPKGQDECPVSQEAATRLAREACRDKLFIPDDCPVKVEMEGDVYVITLVYVPERLVPGPVYYAKVWVDRKTGEIRRLLAGS